MQDRPLLLRLRFLPPWLLALIPVLLWGSSFLVTKSIYVEWLPITVAAARWLIATLFFWGLVVARNQGALVMHALKTELATVLVFGIVGVSLLYAVQNLALSYTTITNASVLGNMVPIFVLLLSVLLLKERPSRTLIVAILGATVGATLLSLQGGAVTVAPEHLVGDGLSLLAAMAGAVYVVFGKRIVDSYPPVVVTFLAAGVGTLVLVPMALLAEGVPPVPSQRAIGGLLLLGLGSSALANLVWWMVAARMPASRAALYILLVPVVGALMGILLASEPVTWAMILGGGMVLASLYIAQLTQA